jgi:sulfate transport system substrate-binding protein
VDRKTAAKYAAQFPKVKLFTLGEIVGDWQKTNKVHFADGGIFDQIYQPGR